MKFFSVLLILAGVLVLGISGYQLIKTEQAQKESLAEAQALVTNNNSTIETSTENPIPADFIPVTGKEVGVLNIPKLNADLPIIEGTHEDELSKGVGHFSGTAYPLQNDQIVLSGHRDTVFRRMGELEIGDILTIQLSYGNFSYEIVDTKVVDAEDRTIIVPTAPDEILTVTTCYPFSFIGNAPDRYIITALPVAE